MDCYALVSSQYSMLPTALPLDRLLVYISRRSIHICSCKEKVFRLLDGT